MESGTFGILMLLIFLVGGLIGTVIYFIPTIVAFKRNHINRVPIMLINLLLGWSLVGWVVAIAWAFKSPEYIDRRHDNFDR